MKNIKNKKINNNKIKNKYLINNIFNKIKKGKNNIKIKEGFFQDKDFFSPTYINLNNPKFLEIDNYFYSGIIITNYFRENNDLILKSLLDTNINMNISIFYEKCDTSKVIKELTYNIGNVGAELKQFNDNRQDIDIAAFTYNDAKYIRKEIQINNEEMYFLYIYLNLFSEDKKELKYNIEKIEGILQSRGLQTRRSTFREEQLFISCLPLQENKKEIKTVAKRNILTSGLISTYPFISSSIFDENGIYIGDNMYNNSLVLIDRYDTNKYKNANMCIFGTSGAGKSFYTKLIILRNVLLGIEQYVIDPEREYQSLARNLDSTVIKLGPTSENYINVFDIRKESIEENEHGYLATKIGKLIGFFNLIFGELNEEEKAILEEKIIQVYKIKKINFNDKSLYNKNKKFKSTKDMPILEDFYNILNDEKTKKFKIKLIPFIKGSLKFFNNYTNIELNKKLIIADVYELGEENMKFGMYLFVELFWDKIKINRKIKKESIIELRDYFKTKNIEGKNEVYIINDVETLNVAAANAILKFLEEPDSNAVAIFTTTNLDSVIKTITSRCQLIKTNNVRTKYGIEFVKELTNLEEDQIYDIIDFTKSLERNYNKAFSCVKTNIVDVYNSKELLSSALKVMLLYYKDMLNYNIKEKCLYFEVNDVKNVIKSQNNDTISKKISFILENITKLEYNVNILLFMDNLLIGIGEILDD